MIVESIVSGYRSQTQEEGSWFPGMSAANLWTGGDNRVRWAARDAGNAWSAAAAGSLQ